MNKQSKNQIEKNAHIQALVEKFQATGNQKCLTGLFHQLEQLLYHEALRYDAHRATTTEDLLEIGRLKIFDMAKTYDLTNPIPFEKLIQGPIHDAMREEYNRYKNAYCISRRSEEESITVGCDTYLINDDGEMFENPEINRAKALMEKLLQPDAILDQVPKALSTLSQQERQIILLSFGIECNPKEDQDIAKQLQITINQVAQKRARILRKLHFRFDVSQAGKSYHLAPKLVQPVQPAKRTI